MAMKVVDGDEARITNSQMSTFWRLHANQKSHVNRDTLQAYLDGCDPFKNVKPIVGAGKKSILVLAFFATAIASAVTALINPIDAFQDRHNLVVWENFQAHVLPALKPISSAPKANFVVSHIALDAKDSVIRNELPGKHLAEWYHVTSFIDRQPNGEDGTLLTNGFANIFYMRGIGDEVFAVVVRWNADTHKWHVLAWPLDKFGGDRVAGRQVFSLDARTV